MDENSPVKDILYQELEKITEEKIQSEISKGNNSKLIHEIISRCYPKILKVEGNKDENAGIFAESLMHYLLTLALIPSQRKIEKNNIEIDIVVPELKRLRVSPQDSVIICFPKSANQAKVQERIHELEQFQPVKENIWVVLHTFFQVDHKTYLIRKDDDSFTKILDDLMSFLSSRKQTKFKIIKS